MARYHDPSERIFSKKRGAPVSRLFQAVADVGSCLFHRKRFKPATRRNALAKLFHGRLHQRIGQERLP